MGILAREKDETLAAGVGLFLSTVFAFETGEAEFEAAFGEG